MKINIAIDKRKLAFAAIVVGVAMLLMVGGVYAWYADERMLPNTWVGSVPIGGLTRDEAATRLMEASERLHDGG